MGFDSPAQEERYMAAVREHPKFPNESPLNYVARIEALINGEDVPEWRARVMQQQAPEFDEERAAIQAEGARLPYRDSE